MHVHVLRLNRIAGKNFVRVYFRYGEPQNEKLTHENLDSIGYYDDVLWAYNESKTHENTLSRPENEN